jgi:hypothetical protein
MQYHAVVCSYKDSNLNEQGQASLASDFAYCFHDDIPFLCSTMPFYAINEIMLVLYEKDVDDVSG